MLQGEWVSMGVYAGGNSYGVPEDLMYSFPVMIKVKAQLTLLQFPSLFIRRPWRDISTKRRRFCIDICQVSLKHQKLCPWGALNIKKNISLPGHVGIYLYFVILSVRWTSILFKHLSWFGLGKTCTIVHFKTLERGNLLSATVWLLRAILLIIKGNFTELFVVCPRCPSPEQDLEGGGRSVHQWLLPGQDGCHRCRAGGWARHSRRFPGSVTVSADLGPAATLRHTEASPLTAVNLHVMSLPARVCMCVVYTALYVCCSVCVCVWDLCVCVCVVAEWLSFIPFRVFVFVCISLNRQWTVTF